MEQKIPEQIIILTADNAIIAAGALLRFLKTNERWRTQFTYTQSEQERDRIVNESDKLVNREIVIENDLVIGGPQYITGNLVEIYPASGKFELPEYSKDSLIRIGANSGPGEYLFPGNTVQFFADKICIKTHKPSESNIKIPGDCWITIRSLTV